MTTRQLIVVVALISILAAGLSWWMQRFELTALHTEIKDYLGKVDKFKAWEAGQGE